MLDLLFTIQNDVLTMGELLISISIAFFMGLLISLVYIKSHAGESHSQSFALTLVMLPPVVGAIIFLVGSNIASAFSLAGAFSIIRFRSAPGDSKDITFVLFSMAVGLACGMGLISYGIVIALFLSFIMFALTKFRFGASNITLQKLKIVIPEDVSYESVFESVFIENTVSHKLMKTKTIELGSLYELEYSVLLKSHVDEKHFIDALRCRNGNLNITLQAGANLSDF
ncbi:DUF4956 domain-containing protein [Fusibacter sp. 3D3]|uniref:DUF4956 domain-containing protein n=1 Tax=Fusibacter sp. 3D3 TaxID=1048380 RepID=UPI0008531136|nr:DUF4956 domain-containing protein [Fusibacter sp. 3D3]GAU79076.1 hypothetical protein F3D3_3714 [Fusibacter sp. 3D3]